MSNHEIVDRAINAIRRGEKIWGRELLAVALVPALPAASAIVQSQQQIFPIADLDDTRQDNSNTGASLMLIAILLLAVVFGITLALLGGGYLALELR